jgi:DUF4097 and DUF4098 domain-containing protein YvlB
MLVVSLLMWSGLRVVVKAESSGPPSATVHESFAAAPNVRVVLENVSGPIVITPSSNEMVDISAVKRAANDEALASITVKIDKDGNPANEVSIRTRYDHNGHGGSVDYTLSVPRRATLKISNVAGNIVANGFANDVSANDISGSVSVENIDGNLRVRTVNGGITASVTRVGSRIVSLHSVSGTVRLTIPRDSGAVVKAQSMSGGFQSDFPLQSKSEFIGTRVDGQIGNGAGRIELETVNGMLELKAFGR